MTMSDQYAQGKVPFTNYVIAVVDTPGAAQEARAALEAEGFAATDIAISAPLQSSTPESEHQQGTLADPPTQVESLFTEEGLDQEQYAAERRRGHVVIQVQTSKTEDVERAHGVLVDHDAHTIKRVGTWTRENLPS